MTWRNAVFAIVASTLYGLSDELHQSFVPNRTSDIADLMADGIGACVGCALGGILRIVAGVRKSGPRASTSRAAGE